VEDPVADPDDRNSKVIDEFRANDGRVGGPFAGAPMVLVHHKGRRSGREYVTPLMSLPDGDDRIYVFASYGGAPANPDWYSNLVAAGGTDIEFGTETFPVTVTDVTGDERDRIYAEQARRYPFFADYEEKTRGTRVIPVIAFDRRR
jgi:deazaflavin-dependent oxidoreductase (nitroreductase family)